MNKSSGSARHRATPAVGDDPTQPIGRLSRPPDPVLFELLYEPHFADDRKHVLPRLLDIDAAHLIMLARQEILDRQATASLLEINRSLQVALRNGEDVLPAPPSHRGMYLVYERYFIDQLGETVGGAAHVARSRNDINATLIRLRLRDELLEFNQSLRELLGTALELADEHVACVMSAFTHLQPAQPSTLGHYLVAVTSNLLRGAEGLESSWDDLDLCPMGACAGFGTSFPIDRQMVADLLGFNQPIDNSLAAVASRDYVVRVLSELALIGNTLTRLSQDFQLWGNHAHGFLDLPDDLVSTSSIMPQKRNAYVWENIRGQATYPTGALVNTLIGMKNTPFSNSVEAGSEATAHIWAALAALHKAVRLTTLLLSKVEVRPKQMLSFLKGADTTMTALADLLVERQGLAFRTAHDIVGQLVSDGGSAAWAPERLREKTAELLRRTTDDPLTITESEIARVLEPLQVVRSGCFGGGPAPDSTRRQIAALTTRTARLHKRAADRSERLCRAAKRLTKLAKESLASNGGSAR